MAYGMDSKYALAVWGSDRNAKKAAQNRVDRLRESGLSAKITRERHIISLGQDVGAGYFVWVGAKRKTPRLTRAGSRGLRSHTCSPPEGYW